MRDLTSYMFSCLGGKSQLRVPAAVLVSASCFPEEGTVGVCAGAGARSQAPEPKPQSEAAEAAATSGP